MSTRDAEHSSSSAGPPVNPTRVLTGRVAPEAIRTLEIRRLPADVLQGYRALSDLAGAVSDAMDSLGLSGAIPAAILMPTLPGKSVVRQAITVRNVERSGELLDRVREGRNRMGEHEAYNLASPGDVIVIQGIVGVSNMGGQSATVAHRQQCVGAIIDGSYRDPDASRELAFPIWGKGVTPITGRWRVETVEINGNVVIAGIPVAAGDLVVADDAGVVFVPFDYAEAVLAAARHVDSADTRQKADIAKGVTLHDLAKTRYK